VNNIVMAGLVIYAIIPGRAQSKSAVADVDTLGTEVGQARLQARTRNPGGRATCSALWIPGSRENARPGMTPLD